VETNLIQDFTPMKTHSSGKAIIFGEFLSIGLYLLRFSAFYQSETTLFIYLTVYYFHGECSCNRNYWLLL